MLWVIERAITEVASFLSSYMHLSQITTFIFATGSARLKVKLESRNLWHWLFNYRYMKNFHEHHLQISQRLLVFIYLPCSLFLYLSFFFSCAIFNLCPLQETRTPQAKSCPNQNGARIYFENANVKAKLVLSLFIKFWVWKLYIYMVSFGAAHIKQHRKKEIV